MRKQHFTEQIEMTTGKAHIGDGEINRLSSSQTPVGSLSADLCVHLGSCPYETISILVAKKLGRLSSRPLVGSDCQLTPRSPARQLSRGAGKCRTRASLSLLFDCLLVLDLVANFV